jgi:hypothetical protein
MNIKELINELSKYDEEMEVVLMNEGGEYYEMSSVDEQCLCEAGEDISKGHVLLIY